MTLIKKLLRSRFIQICFVFGVVLAGVLVYLKVTHQLSPYLMPGPVSAQNGGAPIDGYHSHADFELECLHCHEPVHCLSPSKCQQCHLDVAKQKAETQGLHSLLPGTDRCQSCHPEHRGREAALTAVPFFNFDHKAVTSFSLALHKVDFDGTPLACDSCHSEDRFAATDLECLTCHTQGDVAFVEQHGARFGGECLVCHDGVDRMQDFVHSETIVHEGEHADLTCEDCHVDRVFAGMTGACIGCHTEPEVHAGHFGDDCARCHSPMGWRPAQLTQHTFNLDHGDEGQLTCDQCHVENYVTYACVTCHENGDMQLAHADETEIANSDVALEQCSACHPTGEPGEGLAHANVGSSN
jgi:hypothetical protein